VEGEVVVVFSLGQGLLLGILLCGLLAWWLFSGPGVSMYCRYRGLCEGCFSADGLCVCRPDLDQQVECDDGSDLLMDEWIFTPWEALSDEERAEIDGEEDEGPDKQA
jgi:hypothetical protein